MGDDGSEMMVLICSSAELCKRVGTVIPSVSRDLSMQWASGRANNKFSDLIRLQIKGFALFFHGQLASSSCHVLPNKLASMEGLKIRRPISPRSPLRQHRNVKNVWRGIVLRNTAARRMPTSRLNS